MGRHYPGEGWRWDAEEWCGRRTRAGRINVWCLWETEESRAQGGEWSPITGWVSGGSASSSTWFEHPSDMFYPTLCCVSIFVSFARLKLLEGFLQVSLIFVSPKFDRYIFGMWVEGLVALIQSHWPTVSPLMISDKGCRNNGAQNADFKVLGDELAFTLWCVVSLGL